MENFIQDYVRGIYRQTETSCEYSNMLSEIKKLFSSLRQLKLNDRTNEKQMISEEELKKGTLQILISAFALMLLSIIASLIWKTEIPKFISFIIGVALICHVYLLIKNICKIIKKNKIEIVLGIVTLLGLTAFFSMKVFFIFSGIIFLIYFLQGIVAVLIHRYQVAKIKEKYDTYVSKINDLQKRMTDLIPKIREECLEYQKNNSVTDKKNYTEETIFPENFWWQLSAENIQIIMSMTDDRRYDDPWETRSVVRKLGNQFICEDEYSPLHSTKEFTIDDYNNIATEDKVILDIVSRCVQISNIRTVTTEHTVAKHSTSDVLKKGLEIDALDRKVQDVYDNTEYDEQSSAMYWKMQDLKDSYHKYASETETQIYEEYIPERVKMTIWAGQVIMKKIGGKHKIEDYFCQPELIFENLQVLMNKGYNFSYINYDLYHCNPKFLLNFYALFPECL